MFRLLKKIDTSFFILTVFIMYMAAASTYIQSDIIYSVIFALIVFTFIIKGKKIDSFFWVVFVIWLIINIMSYFVNETTSFTTFLGVTIRTFLPYFMIKIVGPGFFDKLVNYIYYLAVISLILYPIDAIAQGLFNSFAPFLNFMTQDEQKGLNGWYIFIYMHNAWAYMSSLRWLYRNSGFMWEPGAYGLMLVFSLAYYLSRNNFKIDTKVKVFVAALITTFSTSGILALILIILAYFTNVGKRNIIIYILLLPVFIYGTIKVTELDFISGKIERYYETMDSHSTHFTGVERVNRFGVMKYNLEQAIDWPFGNGAFDSSYLQHKYGVIYRGPNTLAGILYKWGFLGLILFPVFVYKFYKRQNISSLIAFYLSLAVLFVFFSNPTETKPLYMSIVFFYLLSHYNLRFRYIYNSTFSL